MKIADLPREAKPREKAFQYGIEQLSDVELLAVLIGSGVKNHSAIDIAMSLIATHITLSNLLTVSLNSFKKVKGLNKVNALKLVAAFEVHRRLVSPINVHTVVVDDPKTIYTRFKYLEDMDHEVIVLVMLNRRKEIIREITKYRGTAKTINFDFKEIITELLESKCSSFVLIHNHPDGASKPSQNDFISTFLLKERSEEFGIHLFDHVIIFKNGYYSFQENNHF